jgi:hypothetical protein
MQLEPHVENLRRELAALGALGDDAVAAAAERLSRALGSTLGLSLLDVLAEAALEIGGQLPEGHVEVRLAGQEPTLVYVRDEPPPPPAPPADDGLTARISLRLPESLKGEIEEAAAREGASVNTWIVRTLARGLSSRKAPRVGSRLTGYGRS